MIQKRNAVVVDIDGTVIDAAGVFDLDPINNPAIDMIHDLCLVDYEIILVTHQPSTAYVDITRWLNLNGVPFHQLYTRMTGDQNPEATVKAAFFDTITDLYTVRHLLTGDRGVWAARGCVWELARP